MGPKIASSANLAPRPSWEPPGLDVQAFWGSFSSSQIGRKNATKNELMTESGLPARLELHSVRSAIMEGVKREPSEGRLGSLGFGACLGVVYMGERSENE